MVEKLKILVASPIFDGMSYCISRFISRIKSLDYGDYDILLVDNSKTDSFSEEIKKKYDVNVMHLQMVVSDIEKIVQSRNKILEYAIENSYDYILMMDCDVIPPSNILDKLLSYKKDVVSGLYYGLFNIGDGRVEYKSVAWKGATAEEFERIKTKFPSMPLKSPTDIRRHLTEEEIENGELQEVFIPSAGCMLITRKVFEKIKYGQLDVSGYKTSDDIFFCKKAREAGFKLYCDSSIECEHLIYGKPQMN